MEPDDCGPARGVQDGEMGEWQRGELQQLSLWLQLQHGRGVQPDRAPGRRQCGRVHHALKTHICRSIFQFLTPIEPRSVKRVLPYIFKSSILFIYLILSTNETGVKKEIFSQTKSTLFLLHPNTFQTFYHFFISSLPLLYICKISLKASFENIESS